MRIYQSLLNRKVFDFGERNVAHWFPGHMAKGAFDSIRTHSTQTLNQD